MARGGRATELVVIRSPWGFLLDQRVILRADGEEPARGWRWFVRDFKPC
jgi:hypothetical protein